MYPKLVVGGVCGLAWGTGLRGLMAEVAGPGSTVSWLTVGFILLPAVVVGVLLGWAEHLRTTGGRRGWRWLALSPLVLASIGGGAIGVALVGMAGGYALSRRGTVWARTACGTLAMATIPVWALIAVPVGGPGLALDSPRGLWVALYYYSFLAVLALASSIPHRAVSAASGSPGAPTAESVDPLARREGEHPVP